MLMSAFCKVLTIGTHKGVAFLKNNIYESTLAYKKPQPQMCHYIHTFFTTQHLCV
jgi:hypothetical protein